MIKVLPFLILGEKYVVCNFSLVQSSWGKGSFPRGNYAGYKLSERQFSLGAISMGILSGGNYLWSNCPEATTWGQSSRAQFSEGQFSSEAIILGDNCPGGNNPVGNQSRGQFFSGALTQIL